MKTASITLLSLAFLLVSTAGKPETDLAQVTGRVTTLWGEPCEEAEVSFYELEGIKGTSPTEKLIKQVRTNKSGEYSATDLPYGHYRVDVSLPGYGNTEIWRFYLWRDAKRVLDLGVPMGILHHVSQINVSGRVVDENKSPVENATVTLINAYNTSKVYQTRTTSSGNYSFDVIQIGEYVLWVTKPGHGISTTNVQLGNGERKVIDLKLKKQPPIKK